MISRIVLLALYVLVIIGCSNNSHNHNDHQKNEHTQQAHEHEHEGCDHEDVTEHEHEYEDKHVRESDGEHDEEHEHEEVKFQYTAYSNQFELFAEADAFLPGETANILAHFSELPEFNAVEAGEVTVVLRVNGQEITQKLNQPTRKGIYSFNIKPSTSGKGSLIFKIINQKGAFEVTIPSVEVFTNEEEAHEAAKENEIAKTNTVVFTKEQAWKIEYASDHPAEDSFGQVIKTTAQVLSDPQHEVVLSAKASGFVKLMNNQVLEGNDVLHGQVLFTIAGSDLMDDNTSVKYTEAKNDYVKAKQDYERAQKLITNKIISDKEYLTIKNKYESAQVKYTTLSGSFTSSGQKVLSPQDGFIKEVWIKNGQYVEAGQPVVTISQNEKLMLSAEVQQKYAPDLKNIVSANIRNVSNHQTYTLEQLHGSVLSVGKSTLVNSYLLPVKLQIDNNGSFTPGTFVEVYLKTQSSQKALIVPNTSLLENQGTYFVYVQITPELFEKRVVKIGSTDGMNTEIRQGIAVNDRVVTKGAMLIKLAEATGSLDAHSGHVH